MSQKIERDHQRFRKIVRGKVKSNLSKYIGRGEMIGKKGRDLVSIPLPQLDVPHFRYGQNGRGGVGQGEGEPGQPIASGDDEGDGQGKAGSDPGQHVLEVDISLDEFTAPRLDEAQAGAVMERTHQICPYSKATVGNIDVELRVAPRSARQAG